MVFPGKRFGEEERKGEGEKGNVEKVGGEGENKKKCSRKHGIRRRPNWSPVISAQSESTNACLLYVYPTRFLNLVLKCLLAHPILTLC